MKTTIALDHAAYGANVRAHCNTCSNETHHKVWTTVDETAAHSTPNQYHEIHTAHSMIECCGCSTVSYMRRHQDSECRDIDDDGNMFEVIERSFFPPRMNDRRPMKNIWYVPDPMLTIYRETIKAIDNEQPTLAMIGLRALLEAVCVDKGAAHRNLADKVKGLVDLRFLTPDGANIIHAVRELGNDAAHRFRVAEPHTLLAALQVLEHLLEAAYILPRTEALLRTS